MKAFLGALFAIFLVGCQNTPEKIPEISMNPPFVSVGDQTFSVEIADNHTKRQIGLMWRESMPEDHGMLFIFERVSRHGFWMKNTLIPLDIIWISEEGRVVDVQTLDPCPPKTSCPSATPKNPAKYVLEVNAGIFSGKIGDTVSFSPNTHE